MADVREAFRTLGGSKYDAQGLEDAVARLRQTHAASLSAEYTVERLVVYADRAGWLAPVANDPLSVQVVVK